MFFSHLTAGSSDFSKRHKGFCLTGLKPFLWGEKSTYPNIYYLNCGFIKNIVCLFFLNEQKDQSRFSIIGIVFNVIIE